MPSSDAPDAATVEHDADDAGHDADAAGHDVDSVEQPGTIRRVLGSLQVPIAGAGAVVSLLAAGTFLSLLGETPPGDGFVHGGALLFTYALAVGGFTVFALGLAIFPGAGFGVRFRRPQRALLVVGGVAAVASVILPLAAFPMALGGDATVVLVAWGVPTAVGVLGVATGLAWRAADRLRERGAD